MKLNEILNRPAKLRIVRDTEKAYHAEADIAGRQFEFRLNKWSEPYDSRWNFTFVEKDTEGDEDSDLWNEDGETYDATGRGNEFQVFATAKQFLENAIDRHKPNVIYFEADKTKGASRSKLYDRFVKRWQPAGYKHRKVNSDESSDYHAFIENKYYDKTYKMHEDISQLSPLLKLLRRECAPFLKEVHRPLLRGIKSTTAKNFEKVLGQLPSDRSVRPMSGLYTEKGGQAILLKGTVRKDREVRDSSSAFMSMYDRFFKKHFGFRARSESLFTTFSSSNASGYRDTSGDVYMIFPKGEFKYVWSPYIGDLFADFEDNWGSPPKRGFNFKAALQKAAVENDIPEGDFADLDTKDEQAMVMATMLDDNPDVFRTDGIEQAYGSLNEIMLSCDEYYAVNVSALEDEYDVSPMAFMGALKS